MDAFGVVEMISDATNGDVAARVEREINAVETESAEPAVVGKFVIDAKAEDEEALILEISAVVKLTPAFELFEEFSALLVAISVSLRW